MDVPYFIKEHLWMSAFDEATVKNSFGVSNHPQSCSCTTVVATVMILKVVNI